MTARRALRTAAATGYARIASPRSLTTDSPSFDRVVLALVFLSLAALALHKIVTFDLWWQMAAGGWIREHGLPRVDPYSFAFPNLPWIEQRWLSFVAVHALATRFGLNALILAKLGFALATLAVLWAAVRSRYRWPEALALLIAVSLLHTRLRIRPELATFACLALFLLVFERARATGSARWLWWLAPIQIFWSNSHTLWIAGPALSWTYAACELGAARLRRRGPEPGAAPVSPLVLCGGALVVSVCAFVTPYVLSGDVYPLTILRQIAVGAELRPYIRELRPVGDFAAPTFFFGSYVFALAASGATFLLPRRLVPFRLALWVGCLFVSLVSVRGVAIFGIAAAAVLAWNLRDWLDESQAEGAQRAVALAARVLTALVALSLIAGATTDRFWRAEGRPQAFGFGVQTWIFPIAALAFARQHGLPEPFFAGMGDSGFLIWEGGERSVVLDGRLEVYGPERVREVSLALQSSAGLDALLDSHQIQTAILSFPLMSRAMARMTSDPDWAAVYYDDAHVVFLRRSLESDELADRLELDWQAPPPVVELAGFENPPDWLAGWPRVRRSQALERRAQLLTALGALAAAREVYGELARRHPGLTQAWLGLGLIAQAQGDSELASEALARVPERALARPDVLELRSHLAKLHGREDEALGYLAQALVSGGLDYGHLGRQLVRSAGDPLRLEAAQRALGERAQRQPGDPLVWRDLGDLAVRSGQLARAIEHYRHSLELNSPQRDVMLALARCYEALGEVRQARELRKTIPGEAEIPQY